MFSNKTEFAHTMWTFTGGTILVLLQSIISQEKRSWLRLLIGCVLGGVGSTVGWGILQDYHFSPYMTVFLAGIAAVISENVIIGVFNASKEFADKPISVITHFAKMFVPMFGKSIGDPPADDLK